MRCAWMQAFLETYLVLRCPSGERPKDTVGGQLIKHGPHWWPQLESTITSALHGAPLPQRIAKDRPQRTSRGRDETCYLSILEFHFSSHPFRALLQTTSPHTSIVLNSRAPHTTPPIFCYNLGSIRTGKIINDFLKYHSESLFHVIAIID